MTGSTLDWEVVAICLLQGFIQTISRLPPETLQHMLEALEGENSAPEK